jgi:hypothetical protein
MTKKAIKQRMKELETAAWEEIPEHLAPAISLLAAAHEHSPKDEDGESPFSIAIHVLNAQLMALNGTFDDYCYLAERLDRAKQPA